MPRRHDRPDRARRPGAIIAVGQWVLRPLLRLLAPPTWIGTEHLPAHGGAIVCGNHCGPWDALALGHLLQAGGVPPRFMAKAELFEKPVLGTLLRHSGQIPVARGTDRTGEAVARVRAALQRGEIVVMFPEGTYTRDPDGWPMTARTGAARIAIEEQVPLIPVVCWDSRQVWPPRGRGPRLHPRAHLTLQVGLPIDARQREHERTHDAAARETEHLMDTLTMMLARIRHAAPPAHMHDPRRDASRPEEG